MKRMTLAWGRALRAQFSGRMLSLSLLPLVFALLLWGLLLWLFLQPLLDWLHGVFLAYGWFQSSASMLGALGLGLLQVMVVPLLAIVLLVPLMIVSSLLFIGLAGMPVIERHVARQLFAQLERKHGGSIVGSLWINLSSSLIFALLWLATMPLYALAPLALLVHALLWGWLVARVMSYDALAAHASAAERQALQRAQRWPLLAIGVVSGLLGALPGIAWIGGAVISVVLFPFLAIGSVWLYVLIFLFTGLWYEYYCLQALADLRAKALENSEPM